MIFVVPAASIHRHFKTAGSIPAAILEVY